tara:strand:+ start:185 stop:427 length:243 start_codon:yes stop_codon:yes gene_type:complete
MNFYEHTIIVRQDTSPGQLKQIQDKYVDLVSKHGGKVAKTENWGLLNLAYIIKKIKKEITYISKLKEMEKQLVNLKKVKK